MQSSAARYSELVDLKMYQAGKDIDYIKKYGMIYVGTLIINGSVFIKNPNRSSIDQAIDAAIEELKERNG